MGELIWGNMGGGDEEQKDLLRALMNVRMPEPISEEILRVQDEYLSEETKRAGITDIADLHPCAADDRLYLWQGARKPCITYTKAC